MIYLLKVHNWKIVPIWYADRITTCLWTRRSKSSKRLVEEKEALSWNLNLEMIWNIRDANTYTEYPRRDTIHDVAVYKRVT